MLILDALSNRQTQKTKSLPWNSQGFLWSSPHASYIEKLHKTRIWKTTKIMKLAPSPRMLPHDHQDDLH